MGRFAPVGERLGRALVERFAEVVPETIHIMWRDGNIVVSASVTEWWTGIAVRDLVDQDAGDLRENIAATTRNALYGVQDYISDVLGAPWPTSERAVTYAPHRLPLPRQNAVIEGDHLNLWYGDPDYPVLSLPPISMNYLLDDVISDLERKT